MQFDSDTDEGKSPRKIVKNGASVNSSRPIIARTKSVIDYLDEECVSDHSDDDDELIVRKRNKGKGPGKNSTRKRVGVIDDSD